MNAFLLPRFSRWIWISSHSFTVTLYYSCCSGPKAGNVFFVCVCVLIPNEWPLFNSTCSFTYCWRRNEAGVQLFKWRINTVSTNGGESRRMLGEYPAPVERCVPTWTAWHIHVMIEKKHGLGLGETRVVTLQKERISVHVREPGCSGSCH